MNNTQSSLTIEEIKLALQRGTFELQGEFLYGSNRTFLCDLHYEQQTYQCVYKPARGERPLWDFETGTLPNREVAACLLDQMLGWYQIPPCVIREDGVFGLGSLHWFIEHDPQQHYFTFTEKQKTDLQRVVLFDFLINNADRKAGHFLIDESGKIWLIDHGLCFHTEDKLRTVLWDFAGKEIPQEILSDFQSLQQRLLNENELQSEFRTLMNEDEYFAVQERLERILSWTSYPDPSEERRMIPWPLI